ncbi:glycoside hydrolase family 3 N-terminal domain-containing protein [Corynebacterium halotolerans]|uniref:beta-N-acetylhexosaminidase n=1 Tax=Corynebacterium halotolerans YIM 70093 = DSM 44683 TaxID=1121362 RepID=M1PA88_9CORY|nr:glycoside hydrolase family 3 N-terminal domain-containing protein [Corynebacterium halotolerans]AGF73581.1 hypothetical protein A605_12925 [Corynebacterium halotolerans YIM 70093 = DSM 44683]
MDIRPALALVAAACLLVACAPAAQDSGPTETTETTATSPTPTTSAAPDAASTSARESTPRPTGTPTPEPTPREIARSRVPEEQRAKIASLMVVGVTDFDDALAKLEQGVGGIFITSWADPAILTEPGRDIAALREIVDRPFSVSIDFEGGRVQRHSQVLGSWPSPREMALTMSPEQVTGIGREIGASLRHHGITVNFAPVLDVDTVGLEIVGDRSFSADPHTAGVYGAAFARGLSEAGVTPVYKHFPGHGQASGDTHLGLAHTPPYEQMVHHDLPPYAVALGQAPGAVMVGHMVVPGLGDGTSPSTLDPAVYRLLRSGGYPGGVPFDGLVYTDDLSGMRAITDRMPTPEAVRAAIAAGADQALWSSATGLGHAIDLVDAAVTAGEIPIGQIDASALRVQLQLLESGS